MQLEQTSAHELGMTTLDYQRLKEAVESGTADNTRRAYRSDLSYFWAWAQWSADVAPAYPAPAALVVRFILDHTRGLNPQLTEALVEAGIKQRLGPHSISTVRRRISALSVAHQLMGVKDAENPCLSEPVRLLLAKSRQVAVKAGWWLRVAGRGRGEFIRSRWPAWSSNGPSWPAWIPDFSEAIACAARFITEAGLQGKLLGDVMAMSGHKTVALVNGFYQAGNAIQNAAAKLAG